MKEEEEDEKQMEEAVKERWNERIKRSLLQKWMDYVVGPVVGAQM